MPVKNIGESAVGIYQAPAYGQTGQHYTITNTDTINPVYYSDSPGTINQSSSVLNPGDIVAFDGSRDVWLSTLSDTVNVKVDVKFGSRSYALGSVNTIKQLTNIATIAPVAAGNTVMSPFYSFSQSAQGYAILFYANGLINTYFAADVNIFHYDAVGNTVAEEQFTISSYPGQRSVILRGKVYGSQISVQVVCASQSWLQTVTGQALIASGVTGIVYEVPEYYPGLSQILAHNFDRIIVADTGANVSATLNYATLVAFQGRAHLNMYVANTAPAGFQVQAKMESFSVNAGTGPVTNWFGPILGPGGNAALDIAVNNRLNVLFLIPRAGGPGAVDLSVGAYTEG